MEKTIQSFELDLSSLPAASSIRPFIVRGDDGAVFTLEIKNEDNYYYNFTTNLFQATKAGLSDETIVDGLFEGSIVFPIVTDDDQYDISLFAQPLTTKHTTYNEVRFLDGSLDVNSTTGSNSLLLTKVIYQYANNTLTLSPISLTGAIAYTGVSDTISAPVGEQLAAQPFTITTTVANDKALRIIKQPMQDDVILIYSLTLGNTPIPIPGEDIYPTATAAFTGDDINGAITSGSVVRMDNTDLSAVIKLGDKITTPIIAPAEPLASVDSGTSVLTLGGGQTCAAVMAVGDRITAPTATLYPFIANDSVIVVKTINHGGNTAKFEIETEDGVAANDAAAQLADASVTEVLFSSKINRSLTTVTAVETSGTATDFTMSQAIQFRDNAPLTFFNQKNYRWSVNNFAHVLRAGNAVMFDGVVEGTGVTLAKYLDTTTTFADTDRETTYVNYEVEAVDTLSLTPIITKGVVSTQAGAIVFSQPQPLELGGNVVKIGGYGKNAILKASGYDIALSNLAITLTPITTTTSAASNASTSVAVASRNGILDGVSTVSGIGINAKLVDPTVASGAGAVSGAGTIVLSAAQTIEDGATLAFANAGLVATITGNIQVLQPGRGDIELLFDIEKLLSIT